MKFFEHQAMVVQLAKPLPHDDQVDHALIGLITEIGEFADMVKRHAIYGKPLDFVNGAEEIGDAYWYLNLYCYEQRIAPAILDDTVAEINFQSADTGTSMVKYTILTASMIGGLLVPGHERPTVTNVMLVVQISAMLAVLADRMGYTVDQVLDMNNEKLAKKRFKSGAFTAEQALNRDVVAERKGLEGGAA